ncbi:MAG: hypothetical protein ACKPKO_54100, partial [Candidatus Fonsibacter sp.]
PLFVLTRYVACGLGLERKCGILQVADGKNHSGASDIASCVLSGIREMATKRKHHPITYRIKKPWKRLPVSEQRLASIVEVFVADGAADEQLASRMLHHKSCARTSPGHALPNLRLVVRDKPHSARLFFSRHYQTTHSSTH